jgi:hypothetical protein
VRGRFVHTIFSRTGDVVTLEGACLFVLQGKVGEQLTWFEQLRRNLEDLEDLKLDRLKGLWRWTIISGGLEFVGLGYQNGGRILVSEPLLQGSWQGWALEC